MGFALAPPVPWGFLWGHAAAPCKPSGGLAEPIHPEELTESTIEVKEGAAELSLPQ